MVSGALLIRSRLDSSGDADRLEASRAVVVCSPELKPVCDQVGRDHPEIEVTVEDALATVERLSAPSFSRETTPLDAWLAPQPFARMVDENRSFAGLDPIFEPTGRVLARSPLTITIWNDRLAALVTTCGGEVSWRCIGEHAGQAWSEIGGQQSWGKLKPGFPSPTTAATGLLVITQASADELGRTDFARNDLTDPGYLAWLDQLKRAVPTFAPSTGSALTQMLFSGRASFDLAGSTEAQSAPAVATSRDKNELTVIYPAPAVTADVVLVPLRGAGAGEHAREVFGSDETGSALAANGWRVDGQPAADGVGSGPLPDTDGLPAPGVVQALHDVWTTT